jgi:hypothetical protein
MQFIKNGPDVPDRLVEAHEDGRVVFFCGAGISYPAGLPTFRGLVEAIYGALGESRADIENTAFKQGLYDTTLGLLENRITGGRAAVRRKLAEALEPDYTRPNATATHEALLTLSRSRSSDGIGKGKSRLITTNFDRIFERLRSSAFTDCSCFSAPLLPVPKQRWDGLVYLHGLLPEAHTNANLDHLVVTSGDFGLAYLSERWASRFVSELFRNYTVCFVGYSINDPILRYMRDALAADKQLGESQIEAFAFGAARKGREDTAEKEWLAKNVTPILYKNTSTHQYLHDTLKEWAGIYRDGISGKERIIVDLAPYRPAQSTKQDDPIGRLLWALVDRSGVPARKFADLDPLPPIEWLGPLSERRFVHDDLSRFGVTPNRAANDELRFSVVARPSPYLLASQMVLVSRREERGVWDEVMMHLGRWLARHLDKKELLLWIARQGATLHPYWRQSVEDALAKGTIASAYRTLWYLILAGRVTSANRSMDLFGWVKRWRRDGFSPLLRLELRQLLSPMITIDEPWSSLPRSELEVPTRVSDIVNADLVLATQHARSLLKEVQREDAWLTGIGSLLEDFKFLLSDALELATQVDEVGRSYLHIPSIEDHPQNKDYRDWTLLVELCRDAWLATAKVDPVEALETARQWSRQPHTLFRRLALFAAAQDDIVDVQEALEWLLADNHTSLWSIETQREVIRLLVRRGPDLSMPQLTSLEDAIVDGPSLRAGGEPQEDTDQSRRISDHMVWLRLAKLSNAGVTLNPRAGRILTQLTLQHPNWQLARDDRDEFPTWIGEDDHPQQFQTSPGRSRDLAQWLVDNPTTDEWDEQDDWKERCRTNFPRAAAALLRLATGGTFVVSRWREALQVWSDERNGRRSWRWLGPALARADFGIIQGLGHALSYWLQSAGRFGTGHDGAFFRLVGLVLETHQQNEETELAKDAVSRAINHPIGHVTEAALLRWYSRSPKDLEGLPADVSQVLTLIARPEIQIFRHGRVLLGAHAIALYRVDSAWTKRNALPLFNWSISRSEAAGAWQGFLWTPRFYIPLISEMKSSFLDTANYFDELADFGRGYAGMLALAGLEPRGVFSASELRRALRLLSPEGLAKVAHAIYEFQVAAGETRHEYWVNRTWPYIRNVWPKSTDKHSPEVAAAFARICVAAGSAFDQAFEQLKDWLIKEDYPGLIVAELKASGQCTKFPETALRLLAAVVGGKWPPTALAECMEQVRNAKPSLSASPEYVYLESLLKARGRM